VLSGIGGQQREGFAPGSEGGGDFSAVGRIAGRPRQAFQRSSMHQPRTARASEHRGGQLRTALGAREDRRPWIRHKITPAGQKLLGPFFARPSD
jgi:hypothetical protein